MNITTLKRNPTVIVKREWDTEGYRPVFMDGNYVGRAKIRERRYGGTDYCCFLPAGSNAEWHFGSFVELRQRLPEVLKPFAPKEK